MTVAVLAPAKLTLTLHVTGRRDDGYHLIEAEMVTLDLADELRITPDDVSTLDVVSAATGLDVPQGPDNLVLRALAACGRTARVELVKRIPAGAGLGGGSADAAAVLRWAGVDDPEVALRLGADVPFCLVGGWARVTGIGEVIAPLKCMAASFTLLTPTIGVSTPDVYRTWDELGGPQHPVNDLTEAALRVAPELARWRDHLAGASGQRPILAGSGATWFVRGSYPDIELDGTRAVVTTTTC